MDNIDNSVDSYMDSRCCDHERAEKAYEHFCHVLADVDPFQIEESLGLAAELCMENECTGFVGGIKTGLKFFLEVAE